MRKAVYFLLFYLPAVFLFGSKPQNTSLQPILVLNEPNTNTLPAHFRTTDQAFQIHVPMYPSRAGLESLHASGSAQFSEKGLNKIMTLLNQPGLVVVDLRQESHGFINGMAVAWYTEKNQMNVGKSLSEIELDETSRIQQLIDAKQAVIYKPKGKKDGKASWAPFSVTVKNAYTESTLCSMQKIRYFRIPVTDNSSPTEQEVERFVQFVKTIPKGAWLHFHCKAGKGRTTTFLCMYDMLRNAKTVSFDDIVCRQWLLGGENLNTSHQPQQWQPRFKKERFAFLQMFYDYCRISEESFPQSWSRYLSDQKRSKQAS
jgi:hypothetical protein